MIFACFFLVSSVEIAMKEQYGGCPRKRTLHFAAENNPVSCVATARPDRTGGYQGSNNVNHGLVTIHHVREQSCYIPFRVALRTTALHFGELLHESFLRSSSISWLVHVHSSFHSLSVVHQNARGKEAADR